MATLSSSMDNRSGYLLLQEIARAQASLFKITIQSYRGLKYYCIYPFVTNSRICYFFIVRLKYYGNILFGWLLLLLDVRGFLGAQLQQQQQPESGYQLLKAPTFIANCIAIQAYLGHEMDQHSTLALQYGY